MSIAVDEQALAIGNVVRLHTPYKPEDLRARYEPILSLLEIARGKDGTRNPTNTDGPWERWEGFKFGVVVLHVAIEHERLVVGLHVYDVNGLLLLDARRLPELVDASAADLTTLRELEDGFYGFPGE